jgi:thiol-disulfide isomerase/thioredoxin
MTSTSAKKKSSKSVKKPVSKQKSGSNWIFIAVIAVVLVGGVAAVVIASMTKDSASSGPSGSAATTAPAQRQPAPALSGTDMITGQQVNLADMKGKPTMVVAWAHWCPHCQKELPQIQQVSQDTKDKYNFITFTTSAQPGQGPEGYQDPQQFIDTVGLTIPVIDDADGSIAKAWGVQGFPSIWVLDSQGRIAEKASGEQGKQKLLDMLNSAQ